MTMQISLFLLMICSAITGLIVEAIKKMAGGELKSANMVAAIVGVVVGSILPIGYILYNAIEFNIQNILVILSIAVLSWLCSMLGFDKVVQTIRQMGKSKEENW